MAECSTGQRCRRPRAPALAFPVTCCVNPNWMCYLPVPVSGSFLGPEGAEMDSGKTGGEETARQGFCPLGAPRPGPLPVILSWTLASPFPTNCQPQGTRVWVSLAVSPFVRQAPHVLYAVVTHRTIHSSSFQQTMIQVLLLFPFHR